MAPRIFNIKLLTTPNSSSNLSKHLRTHITTTPAPKSRTMSSNSTLKPITIWGKAGPNPPKVHIVAKELGIPHDVKDVSFPDLKQPDFLKINPNGRMPAIQDPNTDLTLWESGAIIEYLVDKYDTERKISFEPGSKEYWLAKQWLFFQGTGYTLLCVEV